MEQDSEGVGQQWDQYDSRQRTHIILFWLTVVAILIALLSAYQDGRIEWRGLGSNLATGLFTLVITFILIDRAIGGKREQEVDERRIRELKKRLINDLKSRVDDIAQRAIEELTALGWLTDGTLQGTDLTGANLRDANLLGADFEGAIMVSANLQGARLADTNFCGAVLLLANLRGAMRHSATWHIPSLEELNFDNNRVRFVTDKVTYQTTKFDKATMLPDGSYWTPDTDMQRFLNPDAPNFWQPPLPGQAVKLTVIEAVEDHERNER